MRQTIQLGEILVGADPGFASGENTTAGVLQVRMNNVSSDGTLDWSGIRRVPADERKRRKYALEPGDIVFNSTNSPELVGKTAVFSGMPEPVVFSNHFLRLKVDIRRAEPGFVAWWLHFQWQQRQFESLCTRWVNQASVRKDDLVELRLDLPSLAKQREAAAILDHANRFRYARHYGLELSEPFSYVAFRKHFGHSLDQGPFRQLGELVRITGGGTPSRARPDYFHGQTPWLTSKDMRGDYIWDTEEHITDEAIRKSSTKLVPVDSVLLVVKSKVLMHRLPVAINKVRMCHGQDIKSIQCGDSLEPEFVRFLLRHYESQLLYIARGANTEGLNLTMLEELQVPEVDLAKQRGFASLVEHHERLRSLQREALRQAEYFFESLLHGYYGAGT